MQTEKANKGIGYETLCLHHNAFACLPASDCGTRIFRLRILGCRERGLDEFALHQARQEAEEATKADL